jgi:hypothetical protein
MIIFGTRARYRTVEVGDFFCPHCQKPRPYEHKRGKNYFALYFIPIFPMGDGGEFIECQHCGMSYNIDVLAYKPKRETQDVNQLLNKVKAKLDMGTPVEYVIGDLTAEKLDRDIAFNVVRMAAGDERRVCPKCDLTYAMTVDHCPACRTALS